MEVMFKPSGTEKSILCGVIVPIELTFQPAGKRTGVNNIGKCDVGIVVGGVIDEHEYVGSVVIGPHIDVVGKGT